jgi:hypothetical protein
METFFTGFPPRTAGITWPCTLTIPAVAYNSIIKAPIDYKKSFFWQAALSPLSRFRQRSHLHHATVRYHPELFASTVLRNYSRRVEVG